MDQFSFHGPFAYRWIDDVPVERIDLRSGERRSIEMGLGRIPPVAREADPASPPLPLGEAHSDDGPAEATETLVRAAMAAWN
ncbi:MAG: hypothetical protein ACK6AD_12285 [Cyanobacteriota bacterium]